MLGAARSRSTIARRSGDAVALIVGLGVAIAACAPLPKSGPRPDAAEGASATNFPDGTAPYTPANPRPAPRPGGAEQKVSGAYSSGSTASGARAGADAAGAADFDHAAVADADPREEPRSRYGNKSPYVVFGVSYKVMDDAAGYKERGIASWYGAKFHGAKTSSGEPYDMYSMSAAHRTLPLPTYCRVTNLANGRSVIVRVNDRGPFKSNRVMDLSYAAALKLGIVSQGTGMVEVEAIDARKWIRTNAAFDTALAPATVAGTLVAPAAPPAVAPAPTGAPASAAVATALPDLGVPAATPTMWLQLGAFGDRARAEALRDQLQRGGAGVAALVEVQSNGRTLTKVRLGPFGEVGALDAATKRLTELGHGDYQLVIE